MKLTTEQVKTATEMIGVGANKKKIKMHLMKERGGKPVAIKQIHNVQTNIQKKMHGGGDNDLQKLYDILSTIPNVKVRFISNQENELVGTCV